MLEFSPKEGRRQGRPDACLNRDQGRPLPRRPRPAPPGVARDARLDVDPGRGPWEGCSRPLAEDGSPRRGVPAGPTGGLEEGVESGWGRDWATSGPCPTPGARKREAWPAWASSWGAGEARLGRQGASDATGSGRPSVPERRTLLWKPPTAPLSPAGRPLRGGPPPSPAPAPALPPRGPPSPARPSRGRGPPSPPPAHKGPRKGRSGSLSEPVPLRVPGGSWGFGGACVHSLGRAGADGTPEAPQAQGEPWTRPVPPPPRPCLGGGRGGWGRRAGGAAAPEALAGPGAQGVQGRGPRARRARGPGA